MLTILIQCVTFGYFLLNTYAMAAGRGTIIIASEEEGYYSDKANVFDSSEGFKLALILLGSEDDQVNRPEYDFLAE